MCARCLVILSVLAALLMSSASAEIPQLISYQGKVTDSGGTPIADGDYSMTFTLYDAATGGSPLWSSGAVTVTVRGGVFSVLLGESPQPALPLAFDVDYWVETSIEGDLQSPRTRLASVGYAYMASGIVPGTEVTWTSSYPAIKGTNYGAGAGLRGDSDQGIGVRGESSATNGKGVYGVANASTGTNYGVYGETSSTSGFAGYFSGRARVTGDLTVTSGGKVGIGVTSPGNPLVIAGAESDTAGTGAQLRIQDSVSSAHAFALRIGASGNNNLNLDSYYGGWQTLMTIDRDNGRVGLGTHTPDRDLSVVGYVRAARDTAETNYTEIYHGGSNALINWNGAGNLDVRYANSAVVTVEQDGDVGIGTTSPGAKLDVRGSAVFNEGGGDCDFRVEGDTRPNLIFADAGADRVGIGTASPGAVLDVQGGPANVAVRGETSATDGKGIHGIATGTGDYTYGVVGFNYSEFGAGVLGQSFATSGGAPGGFFVNFSTTGRGVYGYAVANTGTTVGVYGESDSPGGRGVFGFANATTGTTNGVRGKTSSASGYGVYFEGGLAGSGTKSCVVRTSRGPALMYCQESPENWFEDFGEGKLVNGECHIELDPLFLETVTIGAANPMKVFVQLEDEESAGLRIRRGLTGFDVEHGASNTTFWYRIVAKRRGFEVKRLDYCKAAETDSYLYPELREAELRGYAAERARMEEESLLRDVERERMPNGEPEVSMAPR